MLEVVGHPVAVNPDRVLAKVAREREWEVMQFTKWWTCQPDNYDQVVEVNRCPEAMGLDVTATMKSIGVVLEWPPRELAVQVALAGTLKRKP